MECWASILGDCGKGQSREHYVSDGILNEVTVTAIGLPWCRDEPRTIGLAGAVAKILCGKHNEDLSPFDAEAAKLSRFLEEHYSNRPVARASIRLNGFHFEKWALKTLFNLGYIRALAADQPHRMDPPEDLVRYIFRNEPVPDGVGLYFVSSNTDLQSRSAHGVTWNPLRTLRNVYRGMTFTIRDVRFVVSVDAYRIERELAVLPWQSLPSPLLPPFSGGESNGNAFSTRVSYRPRSISMRNETAGEKRIEFEW